MLFIHHMIKSLNAEFRKLKQKAQNLGEKNRIWKKKVFTFYSVPTFWEFGLYYNHFQE